MWEVNREAKFGILPAPEIRASGGNDRSLALARLRVLNYRPYLDKYERSSADARPKGFNAQDPVTGTKD